MNSFSQKENFNKKSTPTVSGKRPLEVDRPEPGANLPSLGASAAVTRKAGAKEARLRALTAKHATGTRPGGLAARPQDGCDR
jgi:hypothetical protein